MVDGMGVGMGRCGMEYDGMWKGMRCKMECRLG